MEKRNDLTDQEYQQKIAGKKGHEILNMIFALNPNFIYWNSDPSGLARKAILRFLDEKKFGPLAENELDFVKLYIANFISRIFQFNPWGNKEEFESLLIEIKNSNQQQLVSLLSGKMLEMGLDPL